MTSLHFGYCVPVVFALGRGFADAPRPDLRSLDYSYTVNQANKLRVTHSKETVFDAVI